MWKVDVYKRQDSYEIGETATAIIPAAAGGRALVSIENGSTAVSYTHLDVYKRQMLLTFLNTLATIISVISLLHRLFTQWNKTIQRNIYG